LRWSFLKISGVHARSATSKLVPNRSLSRKLASWLCRLENSAALPSDVAVREIRQPSRGNWLLALQAVNSSASSRRRNSAI
jgi:hypothetical protein